MTGEHSVPDRAATPSVPFPEAGLLPAVGVCFALRKDSSGMTGTQVTSALACRTGPPASDQLLCRHSSEPQCRPHGAMRPSWDCGRTLDTGDGSHAHGQKIRPPSRDQDHGCEQGVPRAGPLCSGCVWKDRGRSPGSAAGEKGRRGNRLQQNLTVNALPPLGPRLPVQARAGVSG